MAKIFERDDKKFTVAVSVNGSGVPWPLGSLEVTPTWLRVRCRLVPLFRSRTIPKETISLITREGIYIPLTSSWAYNIRPFIKIEDINGNVVKLSAEISNGNDRIISELQQLNYRVTVTDTS
jgi:hypothetical protein